MRAPPMSEALARQTITATQDARPEKTTRDPRPEKGNPNASPTGAVTALLSPTVVALMRSTTTAPARLRGRTLQVGDEAGPVLILLQTCQRGRQRAHPLSKGRDIQQSWAGVGMKDFPAREHGSATTYRRTPSWFPECTSSGPPGTRRGARHPR